MKNNGYMHLEYDAQNSQAYSFYSKNNYQEYSLFHFNKIESTKNTYM